MPEERLNGLQRFAGRYEHMTLGSLGKCTTE